MSTALATLAGRLAERVGMDSVDPQELITTLRQTAFKGDASDAQFIAVNAKIIGRFSPFLMSAIGH